MTPRGRWWRRILVGVILAALVFCAVGPLVLHIVIRRQLQTLVASKLDAHLDVGSVEYVYPYGLVLTNLVMTSQNQEGQLPRTITIPRLELLLAHSPLSDGPLVVDKLKISDPQIHIIRTGNEQAGQASPETPASSAPTKLSSVFQIRELALRGGQIVLEDQRAAGAEPMVLNQLNVNLHSNSDSSSQYTYEVACDDGRRANLRCTGSADVDDLLVKVANCSLSLGIDSAGPDSTLPANIQTMLRSWQAHGIVQVDLTGTVPLRHPLDSVYRSTIQLREGRGMVPGLQLPLDSLAISLDCSDATDQTGAHPRVKIRSFDAVAGDMRLSIADAVATADLQAKTWQLSVKQASLHAGLPGPALPGKLGASLESLRLKGGADFTVDAGGPLTSQAIADCGGQLVVRPHDLTIQPSGFDRPVEGFSDAIVTLANGDLRFESLRATYADNLLFIKSARVRTADLADHFRADNIAGCLTLGPQSIYPAALAPFLRDTRPIGPFFFDGFLTLDSTPARPTVDYSFNVHTTRGRLTLGPSRIPLSGIDTFVTVTPAGANMSKLNASLLDGSVSGTGAMQFKPGFPYRFRTDCRDIELKRLAEDLAKPGEAPMQLSGRGVLSLDLHGTFPSNGSPAYQTLAGNGEFEIRHGDFWEIPIMGSIAGAFSKDALTIGAAAGQFRIGGGKVHFNHAIASSPLLGVEGSGDVTFAGVLDLNGIADPFGSWGERVGDGGALSAIVGAVQRTVNIATSQVLYEIRVTGTTSQPKTSKVLAPLVTHSIQGLLSLTHDPSRAGDMLSAMHKQNDASEPSNP
jgi:hypothetical protein